ncbi:MAG: UPF0235 protein [Parcubacteria group bacterium Gr01-1014_18]|nr:MAG: UPF0235 protein [Parcubacteria group bacterium Greene0416_36]TSC81124.1 MAG: UPF0235 protein [Parcubacteria group bacterium Gr01-1014_18]TSC98459.1 MAG: UPF0235 protein [Parcubacteria group bacterium Greene1014_20]TSD07375.1 MAG: UPF0235 protein [Parcubacteria group bacterium Greene0714_2]
MGNKKILKPDLEFQSLFRERLASSGDLYLEIRASPSSSKTELREVLSSGTWKIALVARPERGKANVELVLFLSRFFDVPKSNVVLVRGVASRQKCVHVWKKIPPQPSL